MCMFVDQELSENGRFPGENRICHYRQKRCFIEDVIKLKHIEKFICIAIPSKKFSSARSPNDAVELTMVCPNFIYGLCDGGAALSWVCHQCAEILQFGFDEYFYCGCGRAPANSYSYHCNNPRHGIEYVQFRNEDLTQELSKMKPHRTLNILLLGETGVGKSTFINGFTNYLNFPTLEQAQKTKPICLIPCNFTLNDEHGQERLIKITTGAPQARECLEQGQSSTQDPLAHVFEARNMTIRLIDTPGLGDVRGLEQDKKNMDAILRYIENVNELHGICILLQSNNSRLNVLFKFCINELLTHLHKDAAKNIVFCFTNTSGTFHRPGDSLATLKRHLSDLKENESIEVPLHYFCFDNEAFRFLMACQDGVIFSTKDQLKYQESWERAESETVRLLDFICKLDPHPVRDTVSVNEARRVILTLAKPMAEISNSIQANIRAIEAKSAELATLDGSEQDLRRRLMIPQITVVAQQLDYPRTVCTSESCTETKALPNTNVIQNVYVTHCHVHCNLDGILSEQFPNPKLLDCVAFEDEHCRCCGCRWELHMHITYDQEIVEAMIEDPNVRRLLNTNQNAKVAINEVIKNCDEQKFCYQSEQELITDISVKFGSFLKKNAMMTYNDAYEEYVDHLIEEEKRRAAHLQDKEKIRRLEQMIEVYREKRKVIAETGDERTNISITPEEIHGALRDLFELPLTGGNIKHLFETASDAQNQHFIHAEQRFEPEPMDIPDGDEALIEFLESNQKSTAFSVHGPKSGFKSACKKLVNTRFFKRNEEKKKTNIIVKAGDNRPGTSRDNQSRNRTQQDFSYANKQQKESWYDYLWFK